MVIFDNEKRKRAVPLRTFINYFNFNYLLFDFPFILSVDRSTSTKGNCSKCCSIFSIVSRGKRDINRHIQSEKHKEMVKGSAYCIKCLDGEILSKSRIWIKRAKDAV